jgi:hypothetical protein
VDRRDHTNWGRVADSASVALFLVVAAAALVVFVWAVLRT